MTFNSWVKNFEAAMLMGRVDEVNYQLYLRFYLPEPDVAFLDDLPDATRSSWSALRDCLALRLETSVGADAAAAELAGVRWDGIETHADFGLRVTCLATRAFPGADASLQLRLQLQYFIQGLPSRLRDKMQILRPRTMSEAIDEARRLFQLHRAEDDLVEVVTKISTNETLGASGAYQDRLVALEEQMAQWKSPFSGGDSPSIAGGTRGYQKGGRYRGNKRGRATARRCYQCGRLGHLARECYTEGNRNTGRRNDHHSGFGSSVSSLPQTTSTSNFISRPSSSLQSDEAFGDEDGGQDFAVVRRQ